MKALTIAVATGVLLPAAAVLASGRITIVSEQDAPKSWAPAPGVVRVVAGYPKSTTDASKDVCVTIGYLIDNEGKTSEFVEMKSWSSAAGEGKPDEAELRPFVQSAAATVSLWRFAPVGKVRQIYTSASFAFAGSKALPEEEIRGRCRIADLPAFVAAAQRAGQGRRMRSQQAQPGRDDRRSMGSAGY